MNTSASDAVVHVDLEIPSTEAVAKTLARTHRRRTRVLANHAVDFLALRVSGLLAVQWGRDDLAADPWRLAA